MKKVLHLSGLDCAHCASKIENEIKKIENVNCVELNFMAQKILLEADDENFDEIILKIKNIIVQIEPDCELED